MWSLQEKQIDLQAVPAQLHFYQPGGTSNKAKTFVNSISKPTCNTEGRAQTGSLDTRLTDTEPRIIFVDTRRPTRFANLDTK